MLMNFTWMQILLPLSIALIIYYGWVFLAIYRKKLARNLSTRKKESFSFSPEKELSLSGPEGPDDQGSFSSIDLPQFREQLCLYIEPYRNRKLDWEVQGEMIRELINRYGRSCTGAQVSLLAEVLSRELANHGIQVPGDIDFEKFGISND